MASRKRLSVSSSDSSLSIELPKGVSSPVVARLPQEKTDRVTRVAPLLMLQKVVKIGKHIHGIRKDYRYDKLMSWNLDEKGAKGRVYWVDIQAPSKSDVDALGKKFNLHPVTVDDINEPGLPFATEIHISRYRKNRAFRRQRLRIFSL